MPLSVSYNSDGVVCEVTDLDGADLVTFDGEGHELDRRPATADELAPIVIDSTLPAQVNVTARAVARAQMSKATTIAQIKAASLALDDAVVVIA